MQLVIKKRQEIKNWYDFYIGIMYRYNMQLYGSLIFKGKKLSAFNFILKLKYNIKLKEFYDFNLIFLISMMNVMPKITLFFIKMGGSINKIPMPLSEKKQASFVIRWLKFFSKESNRVIKVLKMTTLIISSLYSKGDIFDKKNEVYKIALENRYLIKYFK